jgi:hypothetical protein
MPRYEFFCEDRQKPFEIISHLRNTKGTRLRARNAAAHTFIKRPPNSLQ